MKKQKGRPKVANKESDHVSKASDIKERDDLAGFILILGSAWPHFKA